jgi:hypothetical protein
MRLDALSKRARAAIAASGIVDLTNEDAAERLLAVHGCGRSTLREIAGAVASDTGRQLGGFEQAMRGYDAKPTITTEGAARALGVEADEFLALARKTGVVPKRRQDGRLWSEWDVVSVRRFVRAASDSG